MLENERFLAVGVPKKCTHDLGHGLNENEWFTCAARQVCHTIRSVPVM